MLAARLESLQLDGRNQSKIDKLAAQEIRRISRDQRSRLNSIREDSIFVRKVAERYPALALIANLRCGAWYTPPSITTGSAYFKSTDGHTNQWGFSLKRSNLGVCNLILQNGGCIIVDSTRRGKSMPDALSKTIPIWCAVLNLASQLRWAQSVEDGKRWEEHGKLRTPDDVVSPSEHDQISQRIERWTADFLDSDLEIPRLPKPLKPIFITPQSRSDAWPDLSDVSKLPFMPVICLSASRLTEGGMAYAHSTPIQVHEQEQGISLDSQTFVYMQGAGDDHENWAQGLTPDAWWDATNHPRLLQAPSDEIEDVVREIVGEAKSRAHAPWFAPGKGKEGNDAGKVDTGQPPVARIKDTMIVVRRGSPGEENAQPGVLMVVCDGQVSEGGVTEETDAAVSRGTIVKLGLVDSKRSLPRFKEALRKAIDATIQFIATLEDGDTSIVVCDQGGKDLTGSVAVALLAVLYSETRDTVWRSDMTVEERKAAISKHAETLTKDTVRRRLQWLISDASEVVGNGGPGRVWLNRVNEVLLSNRVVA